MGDPYPISRTEIEKSDEIPKSVDYLSKPCKEKLSREHYRVLKKFSERFRKHEIISLSMISKVFSSHG
jgi:RIO-like serine/threonine protein kinase